MSLIDTFLKTATDEFGNKIDFSNVEVDGFSGVVSFGSSFADIYVDLETMYINDFEGLNKEHTDILNEFGEYVQQKMKEHKAFLKDQINTEKSLK